VKAALVKCGKFSVLGLIALLCAALHSIYGAANLNLEVHPISERNGTSTIHIIESKLAFKKVI